MRATSIPSPIRQGRRRLLGSCAIAAGLAALAFGGPAMAQVAGTGQIVSGSGTISPPDPLGPTAPPNSTQVQVTGAETIINWTPTDNAPTGGAIDFLPAGNTLEFYGSGQYTVLNRFTDASGGSIGRQVALNGTVNSYIGSRFATGGNAQGGSIWFYNAGGILIGSTGVLNVGSLVLTSNDIDTAGGLFGPGGEIRFRSTSGSTSRVEIASGANVNAAYPGSVLVGANPGGSYVALVAPRIVQNGIVTTDGSTAYVAAEQADIRINGGLFDINVLVGAEGGTVITHGGRTVGPAHQQGDSDQNRIYMVAIPKNNAVSMLVSGQIGYDEAVTAQTEPDGSVVLSAGYNVNAGTIDAAPANGVAANITLHDVFFDNDTEAHASGAFVGQPLGQIPSGPPTTFLPVGPGLVAVDGNATFIGDASASLTVGNGGSGQTIGATGDLTLLSGGANGAPGSATVTVNDGGTLVAGGTLTVSADGSFDAATGDSQGGTASFTQNGGVVSAGQLRLSADGIGSTDVGSSIGTGGTATMNLLGGTLNVVSLVVQADGIGGTGSDGTDDSVPPTPASAGGAGQGGSATITVGGTAAVTAENMQAHADGQGGAGGDFSAFAGVGGDAGAGANGTGGTATITIATSTLNSGSVTASANGTGGNGGNVFSSSSGGPSTGLGTGGTGGTGQGGTATIDTSLDIPILTSNARGLGGNGGFGIAGGDGGSAIGGLAHVIVNNFDAGLGNMTVDASAQGGNGSIFSEAGAGGDGGDATGGTGRIEATGTNGAVTLNQSQFITGATGGTGGDGGAGFFATFPVGPAGGQGGDGTGGTLEIVASNGATVTLGSDSPGFVPLSSTGTGGVGGAGAYNGFVEGSVGGAGGNGGAGIGGTVHLLANGGTITSGTDTVAIDVAGTSGSGGTGGTGGATGGDGAAGTQAATTGGRVVIEIAPGTSPGQINLGATSLTASGDNAGRIELRTNGGGISMASLTAQASGLADPTSNNAGVAPAGIFLAANGGAITTGGDMTLTTGSSVGAYGTANGTIGVGGALAITAGDQIDIRHDSRAGTAPTIGATGNITATATNGISAATGSLIDAGGTLSLLASAGPIAVDRLHGADIVLNSSGATTVEHAEADNDFSVQAASFATGLNSIITGGDIDIFALGTVDLGNSSAGGFVDVEGQAISFNSIDAGAGVFLVAGGGGATDGLTGGNITAGSDVFLYGKTISLSGTIQTPASVSATTFDGDLAIGLTDVAGNIGLFVDGDLTGTYRAGGNVNIRASGNATVEADAAGTYLNPSGIPSEGYVFVDAAGDATLTDSSAATMLGVRSGGATSITGGSAGEDIFVLAGTTATLANLTAGDDLEVTSGGAMTISNAATLGTGADDRRVVYETGPASGSSPPILMLQIQSSTPDLSNATLSAPTATINATDVIAFSNLTATAGGTVTGAGLLQSGLVTNISGSDLSLEAVTGGTDAVLTATSGGVAATGAIAAGHDVTIGAPGNIAVAELDAGDDVRLDAGGTLSAGAAFAYGTGLDNESDGSNVVATSGGTQSFAGDISSANNTTLTGASITAQAIDAGGDITLTTTSGGSGAIGFTDASAGGDLRATGQSIAFAGIDADAVDLIANGTTPGAEGISGGAITAGDDINLYGNSIALTGLVQGNKDLTATAFGGSASFGTINTIGSVDIDADADIGGTIRSTGDVTLNAGGDVTASIRADGGGPDPDGFPYEGSLFIDAGGNVTLTDSAAARLFGVHGDGSVAITGATAGEDLFVNAGTTATLSGVTAGDDLTVEAAGAISVTNSGTTGAGADGREIFYAPCCSNPLFFVLQTVDVGPDGSNVALTSSGGNIVASDISAFNALNANAAGTLSGTGLLQAGNDIQLIATGAANIADADAGNSLSIDAASIGFDDLSAGDGAGLFATGAIAGGTITAGADIQISGASIVVDGIAGDGSLNAQAAAGGVAITQADIAGFVDVIATGTVGGSYTAGGDIRMSTTGSINASVNALGGYLDPSTDTPSAGNAYLDAGGNIVLADSSAADMLGIRAGGSASVTTASAGEDVMVIAGTTANLSELSAGDDVDVRAGGAIAANDVRATGDGPDGFALFYSSGSGFTIGQGEGVSTLDGADIDLNSSGGAITATDLSAGDDIFLTAATSIAFNGGGTLGLGVTGGDSSIRTQSATATLGSLSAADDVVVNATGAVGVTAPVLAGRDIAITAGSADLATLMTPAGDRVDTLRADGHVAVTTTGAIDGGAIAAGSNVALNGAGGVTVDAITSQGTTSLASDTGAIMVGALASGGAVDASGASVDIRGSGDLVFANLVTDVGDATVRTDGNLSVTNGDVAGLATLGSDNARLTVTALTADGTRLEAFGQMALTNVSVDGDISVYGQSALLIDGVVTGESISLASTDIAIGSNARVGTAGITGSLGITNNDNSRQTFIGGDGTGNGYNIDAGELSRIYGSDIAIHASEVDTSNFRFIGSGPPDVVIDDFTMTAGGSTSNLGANGSLTIDTDGTARVIGDVALTGMTDANTLNILADDSFEVVLGEGSIRLSGASSDAPAGMLRIASEDVIVATLAAIDDVAAATTTDAIEERLAQNDGITSDDGALYAGGINVSVFNGFYVQNSGAGTDYGERRGLTFGAGGLNVNTEGSGTRLVINGVHLGPQGPVTGLDTIPLLTIGGGTPSAGNFDELSTFNGCVIANTGACAVVVVPNESGFPVQDIIEEESNDEGDGSVSLATALITMRAIDPLTGEPLLDDPVTGAGNDDLWTPPGE